MLLPDGLQVRESLPIRRLALAVRAVGAYQYDIRISRQNRLRVYDGRQRRHFRENVVPAAQRYHFADDVFSRKRVQRPVPHLIEDCEPRPPLIACPQLGEFGAISAGRVVGGRGRSGQAPEFDQSLPDVVESTLLGDEDLEVQSLEFGADPWRGTGFPKDDERRCLTQQPLHAERRDLPQAGYLPGGGG